MIFSKISNPDCLNAKPYYYDFLEEDALNKIPKDVYEHIKQCDHCKTETNRLKNLFSETHDIGDEQNLKDIQIIDLLKLHFTFLERSVKCRDVKLFLFSLANPVLQIKTSTPITDHIEKCPSCSKDLHKLLDLSLTHHQLYRLSKILAVKSTEESIKCSEAQEAITSFTAMAFEEVAPDALKHLSICSDCRKLAYQKRQDIIKELSKSKDIETGIECKNISFSDVFDLYLPVALDSSESESIKHAQKLISHLQNCPTCLRKIQDLHNTLEEIIQKPDSEISTTFTYKKAPVDKVVEEADFDRDRPIKVNMLQNSISKLLGKSSAKSPKKSEKRLSAKSNIYRLIKPLAAAAILLIGIFSLFYTPSAKAITLRQVYEALEKVQNVYISRWSPKITGPTQEEWISRSLNLKIMTIPPDQIVFYDIPNNMLKIKYLSSDSIEETQMPEDLYQIIQESINWAFGLTPFSEENQYNEINWYHVDSEENEESAHNIEIYELAWLEKSGLPNKSRLFVDINTKLPQKIEFYSKPVNEDDYILISWETVVYLEEPEIISIIQNAFN